eukprot:scaffold3767_cov114-Isochrysis_galbana.AAC.28
MTACPPCSSMCAPTLRASGMLAELAANAARRKWQGNRWGTILAPVVVCTGASTRPVTKRISGEGVRGHEVRVGHKLCTNRQRPMRKANTQGRGTRRRPLPLVRFDLFATRSARGRVSSPPLGSLIMRSPRFVCLIWWIVALCGVASSLEIPWAARHLGQLGAHKKKIVKP